MHPHIKIRRIVNISSSVIAAIVAFAIPLLYLLMSYKGISSNVQTESEMAAREVQEIITFKEDLWVFEESRLVFLLEEISREIHPHTFRIVDEKNHIVAQYVVPLKKPVITRSSPLYDYGKVVGRIDVSESLRPVLLNTAVAAIFSILLGFIIYFPIRLLPLRTLEKALRDLETAEEELQKSENKYRRLVENAPAGVYRTNLKGEFLYANDALLKIFEFEFPDEMFAEGALARYKNHGDRDVFIERVKKTGKVDNFEIEARAKSGRYKTILLSAVLDIDIISGMIIDITDIRQSEKFIKNIFDSMGEGLIVIDPEYRIVAANRAYCEQVKILLEDILGRHCYKVSHHIDKPCYITGETCAPQYTFETGEPSTALHTHQDEEGSLVYVATKSYPMKDEAGKVISVIETINDITQQKKLEDQLRHSQKMESIGTLAGGIAHDFNNILTAIIGYASVMQMKMPEDDPLRYNLEQILASSERAAVLTQSLLAFSRKQISNPEPVNLNEIVRRAEKFLSRVIGEDIKLKVILSDKGLTVMADSGQIEQILVNLATNARDAMPKGGALTVHTESVEFDSEFVKAFGYGDVGKYACISISDTGIGMDKATKEKIFEPFFTTKEVGKGTGLGLSMVYGIIKQHNGYINCYSELGKGTTFKIYLPLFESMPVSKKGPEGAAVAVSTGGTETILVAEDEESVRKLMKAVLEEDGYKVIEAADGEEAVSKFMENKDKIALLLLDIVMPKKNGSEAYEEMKKIAPEIKALFMSGYTEDVIHRKKIINEGLNFLSKPMSPTKLLKKVREVLDK